MLTFSRPFTVCINFIEAIGSEEIHEKNWKCKEERKNGLLLIYGSLSRHRSLVVGRDRKFLVATAGEGLCTR